MRPVVYLICCILLCLTATAQKNKDIPSFGNVEKSELLLSDCSFDKNADAMVLFDVEETFCSMSASSFFAQTERRTRIKILKQSGLKYADIRIPYLIPNEKIKNLTAQTYNLDASGKIIITKVDKKYVYDKKINKRNGEIIFSFPEVKAGSVLEYKYSNSGSLVDDWRFQTSIPVKLSRFIINFPPQITVATIPICSIPLDSSKGSDANNIVQSFTMHNIPAISEEPFMNCKEDYLQRLEAHIISIDFPVYGRKSIEPTWPQIIKAILQDEDFGLQLKKHIPHTADLDHQLSGTNNELKKMKIIHEFVRKNMEWNGYNSIWALDGVKAAWINKRGTSGEINLILLNLLKDAQLNAQAVLVKQSKNGTINMYNPGYNQFDKVLAYVKIGNDDYILDATDKHTPAALIPLDVVSTEGLVIKKPETNEWNWKTLWKNKNDYKTSVILSGSVKENGELEGNAEIYYDNYARISKAEAIIESHEKFIDNEYIAKNPGVNIAEFKNENLYNDTATLKTHFSFKKQLNTTGDYLYFNVNLFSGLETNPFIANSRVSDIFFGASQKFTINASFAIPENYVFDIVPKNVKMIMPDTSIVYSRIAGIAEDMNTISLKMILEFRKPVYSVNDYPEFHEFYRQLFNFLNEQIVIKKK